MVAINTTTMATAAYGKTTQLGGSQAERTRDMRQQADREAEQVQSAAERREARTAAPDRPQDIRPPESSLRSDEGDNRNAAPPRGSVVDIAV